MACHDVLIISNTHRGRFTEAAAADLIARLYLNQVKPVNQVLNVSQSEYDDLLPIHDFDDCFAFYVQM